MLGILVKSGYLDSDTNVGCALIDIFVKGNRDLESSFKVFDGMHERNAVAWTLMITRCKQLGYLRDAIDLFLDMVLGGSVPDRFTLSARIIITWQAITLFGYKVFDRMEDHNVMSWTTIIIGSRRMDNAQKAFESLFEKNLVSYNTIVDAYAKNLDSERAFELFHEITDTGIEINAFTFASLLSGTSSIGAIGKGEQIHARCGHIEAAFQVFNDMGDRNVISWTSMITGFAKHGFSTRALEIYHEMLEGGTRPNDITYIVVLSACSHAGLISEGWEIFKSMHKEHGIAPRMEHYACMVDLLGRSGLLREAIEFINTMPCEPDALVWRTFLGACQVHNDKVLGEHDAKSLYLIIKFVCICGSMGRCGRDQEKYERKKPDQRRFHVADISHPQVQEIYEKLDEMALKTKGLGYVPDTDFVLHELEEEQKEQYVFQQSEKIAVAFGLISTSRSKPIHVFKNVRVCGDCHTAIKYISMATGREIILRDVNRFHHIKNGTCSCNDYW
ncbi:hypothetical protein REPUB_Repub07fG0149500 [Reevesia pubescens]